MKIRIITLLFIAAMLALAVSCTPSTSATENSASGVSEDREGNPITLPGRIDKVISIGPSNTEILAAVGAGGKIIAVDDYSIGIDGVAGDVPLLSMLPPDGEQLIALEPDVIFVTGMSKAGGEDPLALVSAAGICVIYIPASDSIEGIKEDIRFIAAVMEAQAAGDAIIAEMEKEIDAVREAANAITHRKTVYFEISAAPFMYSFGGGVFLNEMLELIGAENIFAGQAEWISVADEAVPEADPDVILTNVNYIDDPVGEIMSRPGWEGITAIQNGDVYSIDADWSSRPSHNIVKALRQMAVAVHPDIFS